MDNFELTGFEITSQIYHGKRSRVYKAIRKSDRRKIIIKTHIDSHLLESDERKLQHEFNAASKLNNPFVIKYIDMINIDDKTALIMEDINGTSLLEQIPTEGFDIETFLQISIMLASGLASIHSKGIVHKDVKPDNIIYNNSTNELKFIDFGISSFLLKDNEKQNISDKLEGTLSYISPEQTGRMNRSIDHRTDIYSLGITLYKILTNRLPFSSTDPMEVIHSHIAKMPPSPVKIKNSIPEVISNIIIKCIAKNAENRYQSASGILKDLQRAETELRISGIISIFDIASDDISSKFIIPEKLYGRERETGILFNEFANAASGIPGTIFISGDPGIGKSFLINELHKPLASERGYFIQGKFDQLKKNVPYNAFLSAFKIFVKQILTESDDKVLYWKNLILKHIGKNGKILIDVIPDIELIIGKQQDLPALKPVETQNRFLRTFQNFITAISKKNHPLVLFIDDLQWADIGSLFLLSTILTEVSITHFLFIGSYRDKEISSAHPLKGCMQRVVDRGFSYKEIHIDELKESDILQILNDTLSIEKNRSEILAKIVLNKTAGNPFFVKEFLKSFYENEIIYFDEGWAFDEDKIYFGQITDNVADLMISKISKLTEQNIQILKVAACYGSSFSTDIISQIQETSKDNIFNALITPINEGLIIKYGDHFSFAHDKVQETIYSLIPDSDRPVLHNKIGNILLQLSELNKNITLFETVTQLNKGSALCKTEEQKIKLAELNYKAGLKAKNAAAFDSAFSYFSEGVSLSGNSDWNENYTLLIKLYTGACESAFLIKNETAAESLFEVALKNAKSKLDTVDIYEAKIFYYTDFKSISSAIRVGIESIKSFNIKLPENPSKISIIRALLKVKLSLGNKAITSLIDMPLIEDPEIIALLRLLTAITLPAYIAKSNLFPLLTCKMTTLSLKYGNSIYAPSAYMSIAVILSGALLFIEAGDKFANLGMEALHKFEARTSYAKVTYVFGAMINHWKHSFHKNNFYMNKAYHYAIEIGDIPFEGYAINYMLINNFFTDKSLSSIINEYKKYSDEIKRGNQKRSIDQFMMFYQAAENLFDSDKIEILINDNFDENSVTIYWESINNYTGLANYAVVKTILFYLSGNFKQGVELANKFKGILDGILGMFLSAQFYFYYALILIRIYPDESDSNKKKYLKEINSCIKKMKKWAKHAPMNFKHKYLLLKAERAGLFECNFEILNDYENAVKIAVNEGFLLEQAIISESAADFLLKHKQAKLAKEYAQDAFYFYKKYELSYKIEKLKLKYINFLESSRSDSVAQSIDTTTAFGTTSLLDTETIIKATSAISKEIDLKSLLSKIINIILENAGAERGFLILKKENQLLIEAYCDINKNSSYYLTSTPFNEAEELSIAAVQYSYRTGKNIIYPETSKKHLFDNDIYIQRNKSVSILATPMKLKDEIRGENLH